MSENLTDRPNMLNSLGVGVVAVNKQTGSNEIQVYVRSMFPMADGELGPTLKTETTTAKSSDGGEQSSQVMKSTSVPATWRGFDSNRITAPDVRVGSQVLLFHVGNGNEPDQLYWTPWDVGPEKHRLETVVYAFNASNRYDENVPFDPKDYYIIEVSSHLGRINVSTSKANNEKNAYTLSINGKDGQFTVMDDLSNLLHLNSMEHTWLMRNADETFLTLSKENIVMCNKGSTTIKSEVSVDIITETFSVKAANSYLTSEYYQIDCPQTVVNGNITQFGNLGVNGSMTVTGGADGKGGTIGTSGAIHADGDITSGNISVQKHTHDVINHSYTSQPKP